MFISSQRNNYNNRAKSFFCTLTVQRQLDCRDGYHLFPHKPQYQGVSRRIPERPDASNVAVRYLTHIFLFPLVACIYFQAR